MAYKRLFEAYSPKFRTGDILKVHDGYYLIGKSKFVNKKDKLRGEHGNIALPDFIYDVWGYSSVQEIKSENFENEMFSGYEPEQELLKYKKVGNISSTIVIKNFY